MGTGYGLLATPNDYILNTANFAAWGTRSNTQFSFTFKSSLNQVDTREISHQWANFAFDNVAINIPLAKNRWSLGLGLAPLTTSTIGFKVESDVGSVIQRFKGSFVDGYVNMSYQLFDNFYASTAIIFTFGNLADDFKVITTNELYLNNFSSIYSYQGKIPNISLGFQYNDSTYQFSGQAIVPLKGELTIVETGPGAVAREINKELKMPLRLSGGAGITFKNFRLGISGKYEAWQNGFSVDDQNYPQDLTDMILLGTGFESIPEKRIFASNWEKLTWRFGFHGAILNNKDHFSVINEYAIHAGVGIPFNSYFSNFDIGLEFGQRGDIDINLAKEMYLKIGFSFTAGERWFIPLDEY